LVQELKLLEYYNMNLPVLTDRLEGEYYAPIRSLCEDAITHAMDITRNGNTQSPARIYTNFCLNLLFTIKHDIAERQSILLPLAKRLYEKRQDGHDCATCTGNCKVDNDDVDINNIGEANNVIIDSMCRLHKLAMPAYLYTEQPAAYKELRYKMLALYTGLLELFFIEESALFTAISTLQKHHAA